MRGNTKTEQRWADLAATLPSCDYGMICGNRRLGWAQSCGHSMNYRVVAIRGGERVVEFICPSCGDHWRDTTHENDEWMKRTGLL